VASDTKTYSVPVDSTMTDVTFSVDTPSMEVRRPNGDVVQATDADATILQLTGGSVLKVSGPAVGLWTVTIGVSSEYRLHVSGTSVLEQAGDDSSKKARHLLLQAKHALVLAGKAAGKAAKGKKPKLTKDCAAAIQRAAGIVSSGLHL
jgi:hypothetical protein